MNYKIIQDKERLLDFINWLPELQENECYYVCLFARSKYCKNADGTNLFPHIKSDKSQLKRFVVSRKEFLYNKLKQLEVEIGAYKTKDGLDIPQESLAPYITVNPRNQVTAMYNLMKRFVDILQCKGSNFNINAEALSAIQKSKSRTVFMDIDFDLPQENPLMVFDGKPIHNTITKIKTLLNEDACQFLITRGGFHLLVDIEKINNQFKKSWYNNIIKLEGADVRGDNMIPIVGCYQGGFVPFLLK
jgi:hypothetical protein